MDKALETVPVKARQCLQEHMPQAAPFTFTHSDLTSVNIIVKEGNLSSILDWEASGYFLVGVVSVSPDWRHSDIYGAFNS